MGCSQGANARLIVEPTPSDATPTFDASSEAYDFLYEDFGKKSALITPETITGSRSTFSAMVREGHSIVSGKIATNMSKMDLDNWLPRIMGKAESTDVFALDDSFYTVGSFAVLIDRVGDIFKYNGCRVNRAIWRGKAGPGDGRAALIEQILEIICPDEAADQSWPASPPSISVAGTRKPYAFHDVTLTVNSTVYPITSFVLLIDNHFQPRWVNSLTATQLCPADRTIALQVTMPFTAADAIVDALYRLTGRLTGVAATLAIAPSGTVQSTTFTFPKLMWNQEAPSVQGKQEIEATFSFIAKASAAVNDELSVTNEEVA